ncbi:MAG: hypothetical protein KBA38_01535 [Negativicutes bacterium]|jgi:hypothetical protein|nr:hypothetical protein [Negativicutes bacterium]
MSDSSMLGKKIETIEENKKFMNGMIGFLFALGAISLYVTIVQARSIKAGIIATALFFGFCIYLFLNKNKSRVEIYENGLQVEGIFSTNGIFLYKNIGRIDSDTSRQFMFSLLGLAPQNFLFYSKTGGTLTGISSIFYENPEPKMAFLKRRFKF